MKTVTPPPPGLEKITPPLRRGRGRTLNAPLPLEPDSAVDANQDADEARSRARTWCTMFSSQTLPAARTANGASKGDGWEDDLTAEPTLIDHSDAGPWPSSGSDAAAHTARPSTPDAHDPAACGSKLSTPSPSSLAAVLALLGPGGRERAEAGRGEILAFLRRTVAGRRQRTPAGRGAACWEEALPALARCDTASSLATGWSEVEAGA